MKFLLLSGSFHENSRSLAILKNIESYLSELVDGEFTVTIPDLSVLPFYSPDIEIPAGLKAFMEAVTAADAIIVCSPEYNHSIPAVLKNAIDWASRPAFNSPLKDLPVAFITQASSPVGGARAQAHLKLVFDSTLSRIYMSQEMMISGVQDIFDDNKKIQDADVVRRLQRYLKGFVDGLSG